MLNGSGTARSGNLCLERSDYLNTAFGSQRDKHWFSSETFMGLMRLRGMECRAPGGFAEAFYSRKLTLNLGRPANIASDDLRRGAQLCSPCGPVVVQH